MIQLAAMPIHQGHVPWQWTCRLQCVGRSLIVCRYCDKIQCPYTCCTLLHMSVFPEGPISSLPLHLCWYVCGHSAPQLLTAFPLTFPHFSICLSHLFLLNTLAFAHLCPLLLFSLFLSFIFLSPSWPLSGSIPAVCLLWRMRPPVGREYWCIKGTGPQGPVSQMTLKPSALMLCILSLFYVRLDHSVEVHCYL